jgi:hypothetical protein
LQKKKVNSDKYFETEGVISVVKGSMHKLQQISFKQSFFRGQKFCSHLSSQKKNTEKYHDSISTQCNSTSAKGSKTLGNNQHAEN